MKTLDELLIHFDACPIGLFWAQGLTIEQAVAKCPRGEWLLWLASKVDIGIRPLTLAKGHCANTVRDLMQDDRSIKGVDFAIAFGGGNATMQELDTAANDAYAAYIAANSISYSPAAFVCAASAALSAASSSHAASAAVHADQAFVADGRRQNQKQTADICREHIGQMIINKVNELLKD